ncbi:MAG: endonuclease, partial [Armatimonadetes bacterium]|nr:endonuclease [Armatimonadota bacterium]
MEWHSIDPVDEWEENRNDIIYTDYQGNRNPFIDHPEFADLIWVNVSSENDVEKLIIRKLYSYPNPFNPETTISFSISRKDAENAKIEIYNIKGQKVKQFSDIRNKTSVIW